MGNAIQPGRGIWWFIPHVVSVDRSGTSGREWILTARWRCYVSCSAEHSLVAGHLHAVWNVLIYGIQYPLQSERFARGDYRPTWITRWLYWN